MRVLVVEDDHSVALYVQRALRGEGYAVDTAANGTDAILLASRLPYDAIVLDVGIPEPDGLEVCRRLRSHDVWAPVLMLTARSDVPDRVAGLDAGADDYLVKPFAVAELHARLRALTRRAAPPPDPVLQVGDLVLDPTTQGVTRAGQHVELTARERALLAVLMRHSGQVLTRRAILDHVWDFAFDGTSNVVDVHIRALRDKVDRPFGRSSIETVRGLGYRLKPD
jgi:two-component system OmpR family response regulator